MSNYDPSASTQFRNLLSLHGNKATVWMKVQCQYCECTDWFTFWPFSRPKVNYDWEDYGKEKWVKCDIKKTDWYKKNKGKTNAMGYIESNDNFYLPFISKDSTKEILEGCRKQGENACEE